LQDEWNIVENLQYSNYKTSNQMFTAEKSGQPSKNAVNVEAEMVQSSNQCGAVPLFCKERTGR
jgi:hypothetical protein